MREVCTEEGTRRWKCTTLGWAGETSGGGGGRSASALHLALTSDLIPWSYFALSNERRIDEVHTKSKEPFQAVKPPICLNDQLYTEWHGGQRTNKTSNKVNKVQQDFQQVLKCEWSALPGLVLRTQNTAWREGDQLQSRPLDLNPSQLHRRCGTLAGSSISCLTSIFYKARTKSSPCA